MNLKKTYFGIFVLLLALTVNNLHQWQPHAEDIACEVCILASGNALLNEDIEIHVLLAKMAVHNWQHVKSQHLTEGALIEPIRGSPLLIS